MTGIPSGDFETVAYKRADGCEIRADVYPPAQRSGGPVLIRISQAVSGESGYPWALAGFARIAAAMSQAARAARLLGAAEGLGWTPTPAIIPVPVIDALIARLQETLGESAFHSEREAGRLLTMEDAISYALERTDYPGAPSGPT